MSILNSINNAIQGVSNATNSLVGGSVAQPGLSLLGTNLPGVPLISMRDHFLNSLGQWSSSIPLNTQFIILFDGFPLGLTNHTIKMLEEIDGRQFSDITLAKSVTTNLKNQGMVGCIFATGFTILKDRGAFSGNALTIPFRDTNTSFIDFVIRPWLIMASHYGYVARNPNDLRERLKDPKCNITIVQYTRSEKGLSQIPRKTSQIFNCVPTEVDTRDYQYASGESDKNVTTKWVYDHYTVNNNLFMNIEELIKSLNPFKF